TLLATTHRDRVAGMVLYSPAGGPKYRRRQHARFAAHLAYVAEHGLTGVWALARATEAGFSDDGRVGPWVSVLRSDAEFAARYLEECLPAAQYWDVPVAEQTADTAPARVIEFLESLTL